MANGKGSGEMTQQERENKIKELEKQIEELRMAKVEEPQSKRWKPNKYETYKFVCINGVVEFDWGDDCAIKEIDYCPFCGRSFNKGGAK